MKEGLPKKSKILLTRRNPLTSFTPTLLESSQMESDQVKSIQKEDSANLVFLTTSPINRDLQNGGCQLLTIADSTLLRNFIASKDNYRNWGEFLSNEYYPAVEFRNTIERYLDKIPATETYSRSKDGYYDYARWLLTKKIPELTKPRKSTRWLTKWGETLLMSNESLESTPPSVSV